LNEKILLACDHLSYHAGAMVWNKPARLLLLALLAVIFVRANNGWAQTDTDLLALTHANLIDGASSEARRDVTVLVRGARIQSITLGSAALPAGARVLDLQGRWLLPGFVDAHSHVRDLASARRAVQFGTTTVRVMGGPHLVDVGMRELHHAGLTDIPEVVAAGYQIRPDLAEAYEAFFLDFPNMSGLMSGVRGSDNLRHVVRLLAERHVNLIKIFATERAGTPQTDPLKRTFTDEELAAVVDEGGKVGLSVAAHAHSDEAARAAVLAGVHSIEHGTYLSDETLALMKSRGTYFVPTISFWDGMSKSDDPIRQLRARTMQPRVLAAVAHAWKMGIKIAAGTDDGYNANSHRVSDEVAELVLSGMPPMEAIKAATSVSAECLEVEKRIGTIKPGMVADFIAVDGDPLANVAALRDLVLVIHDGRVVINQLNPQSSGPSLH
jgi:imidazolonepropionase-like amidohydrolase